MHLASVPWRSWGLVRAQKISAVMLGEVVLAHLPRPAEPYIHRNPCEGVNSQLYNVDMHHSDVPRIDGPENRAQRSASKRHDIRKPETLTRSSTPGVHSSTTCKDCPGGIACAHWSPLDAGSCSAEVSEGETPRSRDLHLTKLFTVRTRSTHLTCDVSRRESERERESSHAGIVAQRRASEFAWCDGRKRARSLMARYQHFAA